MSPAPGDAPDLVVMSLEPWDEVWRRNQHLVAGLLRERPTLRVLFVEPVSDPLHALSRGGWPRRGRGLRPAPPVDGVGPRRLWLLQPTKLLPRRVDGGGDARRAAGVVRAARRLGLARPVLWVNDPYGATLARRSRWPALYDVTDDWTAATRGAAESRRVADGDRYLVEHAAAVTVCSPALAARKADARSLVLVTNGVDLERYRRPAARPHDLPDGPTAVYVGTLHTDRLDVALCEATARALGGDGTLVLVGPVALERPAADRLRRAGVVLLGARAFDTVPAYLRHADALVVPHVVDEFTDSLDPLKLYEYRAVGRPVVSTPVAGFRDTADPHVVVAPAERFAGAVRDAVLSRSAESDAPTAPDEPAEPIPTWERQVALMRDVVDAVGAGRRPAPTPP
ncbi:glycosyltransferase [Isoptericola sp. NPDC057559]|uniref:glycosyltransferase n=1 Tax=Isoptericola sp. NPDC057559 TaxID=3346168 RepID=UPI0036B807F6